MTSFFKKAGLGAALAATVLTAAAPAEAQRYGYRDYRDDRAGTAVVAGLAGLTIGATLASNRYDRYYGPRY